MYYAIFYDTNWYIGRILKIDKKCLVKFLREKKWVCMVKERWDTRSGEEIYILWPNTIIGYTINRMWTIQNQII